MTSGIHDTGEVTRTPGTETAVLAGGPGTLAEATTGWPGLEVLACAPDGRRWATPAFRA